jgi:subtilisin family serine protease
MGTRRGIAVAALALFAAPAAWAGTPVTVGYTTPAALHGLDVVQRIDALYVAQVQTSDAAALRARPGIRWVQRAAVRERTDEPALIPWASGNGVPEWQWAATRSDLVPSWVQRAASRITIAIVDTGADVSAPDIADKQPITHSVVTGGPDVVDTVGHGTFVASLAAGSITNGDGIAGFGGDARLMIIQANRNGSTFTDVDESAAIVWAVDNGANIVNLSLGGPQTSRIERDAIAYAADHGVLVVAAAGNAGLRGNPVEYPAALLARRGLAVAASTAGGLRAPFSSTGRYVSLAAPGVDILAAVSAAAPDATFPRTTLPGSSAGLYGFGSGTSYATPQVAGAAALVWAANPTLTAQGVAAVLQQTAAGTRKWRPTVGWGVLDVAAAVARASGGPAAAALPR